MCQFLADLYPSDLLPASTSAEGALKRARIGFFTDTWDNKIASFMWKVLLAADESEKEQKCTEWIEALKKEIEPLLKDAKPFFGGSDKVTIAEVSSMQALCGTKSHGVALTRPQVHTGPFLLRTYAFAKYGMLPASFSQQLDSLPNFSRWAHAAMQAESVREIWNEEFTMSRSKKKMEQLKDKKIREAFAAKVGAN